MRGPGSWKLRLWEQLPDFITCEISNRYFWSLLNIFKISSVIVGNSESIAWKETTGSCSHPESVDPIRPENYLGSDVTPSTWWKRSLLHPPLISFSPKLNKHLQMSSRILASLNACGTLSAVAGDRSQGEISPASLLSESQNYPNCVYWHIYYFMWLRRIYEVFRVHSNPISYTQNFKVTCLITRLRSSRIFGNRKLRNWPETAKNA